MTTTTDNLADAAAKALKDRATYGWSTEADKALYALEEALAEHRANEQAEPVPVCGFIPVRERAVNWLKEKYPALCEKAGLCERIGGRLYTVTHSSKYAGQPPASPEPDFSNRHLLVQYTAEKYGPLISAAINLLAACHENHDTKQAPQKFGVPYGEVNALRAALAGHEPAASEQKPLSEADAAAIFKGWRTGPLWLHMVRETERAHGITAQGTADKELS